MNMTLSEKAGGANLDHLRMVCQKVLDPGTSDGREREMSISSSTRTSGMTVSTAELNMNSILTQLPGCSRRQTAAWRAVLVASSIDPFVCGQTGVGPDSRRALMWRRRSLSKHFMLTNVKAIDLQSLGHFGAAEWFVADFRNGNGRRPPLAGEHRCKILLCAHHLVSLLFGCAPASPDVLESECTDWRSVVAVHLCLEALPHGERRNNLI